MSSMPMQDNAGHAREETFGVAFPYGLLTHGSPTSILSTSASMPVSCIMCIQPQYARMWCGRGENNVVWTG